MTESSHYQILEKAVILYYRKEFEKGVRLFGCLFIL